MFNGMFDGMFDGMCGVLWRNADPRFRPSMLAPPSVVLVSQIETGMVDGTFDDMFDGMPMSEITALETPIRM